MSLSSFISIISVIHIPFWWFVFLPRSLTATQLRIGSWLHFMLARGSVIACTLLHPCCQPADVTGSPGSSCLLTSSGLCTTWFILSSYCWHHLSFQQQHSNLWVPEGLPSCCNWHAVKECGQDHHQQAYPEVLSKVVPDPVKLTTEMNHELRLREKFYYGISKRYLKF